MIDTLNPRAWALHTFGPDGVKIREAIPHVLADLHVRMADAQAVSGMHARTVYGQMYRGALEAFCSNFGGLPNAGTFVPRGANYHVPIVEGVAIFPWRFSASPSSATDTPIATSTARLDLFSRRPVRVEEELDLDIDRPELTNEDDVVLQDRAAAMTDVLDRYRKVVVVAYVSSFRELHSIEWGEVEDLTADGYLRWGFHEQLTTPSTELVSGVQDDRPTFDGGQAPRPIVEHRAAIDGDG